MVSNVTNTAATAANATESKSATTGLAKDFNQFLSLLTTQLQNQDPLAPMDSNQFTSQLVQFSQVEQQINMNQKLESLLNLQNATMTGAALGYVGMDVNYEGSRVYNDGQTPVNVSYSFEKIPDQAKISIVDKTGKVVLTTDAAKNLEANTFVWNGKDASGNALPEGTYEIRVGAMDEDGKAVDTTTLVSGRVRGMQSVNGNIMLLVGEETVPMSLVLSATAPKAQTTVN